MKRLINQLPITRIKIFLGQMLYRLVHLIYSEDTRVIIRNEIKYEVDLSEGIDLSLFLFGNFQKHVSENRLLSLPKDAVIFDVGANFGAMSLQYAKLVPFGRVYSFEPTFYAFSKLKKNLELNPDLAKRVVAVQSFVSSRSSGETGIKAYASWKVGGATEGTKHRVHGGILKSADGIGAISLDDFCEENEIQRLDFIKIDTDGHELEVLKGAQKVIGKFRPTIIFEIGIYIMEEGQIGYSDYVALFDSLNYSLFDSSNLKEINANNYGKYIPLKGTIDILAKPNTQL
ncbi:MAG: FkbM family methyltransferase [Planctomycetota bacterium]|jgi:FkbM family methyltransferase